MVAFHPVVLGFEPMDEMHQEFEAVVSRALRCADHELTACLECVEDHLKAHFAAEDAWMLDHDFPARDCHIDEHAAVLRSAAEVLPRVRAGDAAIGRAFAGELDRWFPGHANYLDSALAAWMCQQRFGGKPVVLQKSVR